MEDEAADASGATIRGVDVLPVESWEVPDRRVQIPHDIRQVIGARTNVLRVSQTVDDKIRQKHRSSITFYEQATATMASWVRLVEQRKEHPNWEIFIRLGDQWIVAVIGRNRDTDDYNLISMYKVRPQYVHTRSADGIVRLERFE